VKAGTDTLAGLFLVAISCAPPLLAAEDQYAVVSGRYENRQYAYAVLIPAGLRGYKPKPPAPVHGIFIPLTEGQEARIDVNAVYNTLEYHSLPEASAGENQWFLERCAESPRTVSKPTTLGSMAAISTKVSCNERGTRRSVVLESVVAIRPTAGDYMMTVVYSVTLISSEKRHREDARAYDRVVRSFKLTEVKQ
jgi:hypothetical protein